MELTITTPKEIVLVSDGQQRVVTTTAATAGDLLEEQGIALSGTDRTSLYLNQGLLNRMRLQVYRVQINETSETTEIPFEKVETPDANAFVGDRTVVTPGVAGQQVTRYRVTVVDGVEASREVLKTTVTVPPVAEQTTLGTKERPVPPPSTSGLDWDALAKCEAGGNWSMNSGNGYYGGLQYSASTWRAYGGTEFAPLPHQATREQQIAVGERTYADVGASAWPHCGRRL
jgi:uncharacterized protein YabE (DUF348 family)